MRTSSALLLLICTFDVGARDCTLDENYAAAHILSQLASDAEYAWREPDWSPDWKSWPAIYSAFKTHGSCELKTDIVSGDIARSWNRIVRNTLLKDWGALGDAAGLVAKDAAFRRFVLSHINGSDERDLAELRTIHTVASSKCPTAYMALCTDIRLAAKRAVELRLARESSIRAFHKQFYDFVLSACDVKKLMCRGKPMTVTSESTIEGAGLTIEYSLGEESGLDVGSIVITDSAVVLPNGLRVGDPIANVEKVLGAGEKNESDSYFVNYEDESSLTYVVFFFERESRRVSSIRWQVYRD